MFYQLTKHAWMRMQQRGKNKEGIKMLMRYGQEKGQNERMLLSKDAKRQIARRRDWLLRLQKRHPGNRTMQKKMSKRISALEMMRNCVAIFDNGRIITIYNQTRARFKKRRRFRNGKLVRR